VSLPSKTAIPVSMMQLFASARRSIGVLSLVCAAFLLLAPQAANGQLWLQTSRVVTPVEQGPVRVLLDSLVNVMERRSLQVRRSADTDSSMTVSQLRSTLINEQGIGIGSANHAFIDYRFSIDNGSDFRQEVAAIRFVFRPGPNQTDVPVLYLDARSGWVDKFLHNKGTSLYSNEAALIPFHRHLGFAQIARQKKTQIVEMGGQTVRKGFDQKKEALIRKVERLTYESYV
jgi:hypothetical protein